jgi:hypothetical protein
VERTVLTCVSVSPGAYKNEVKKRECVMSRDTQQNARLDELLAALGCSYDIAPVDAASYGRRIGEVIARSVNPRGSAIEAKTDGKTARTGQDRESRRRATVYRIRSCGWQS